MSKEYLGDGVYCDYDGFYFILTTEDGISITNTIYLEPGIIERFLKYLKAQEEINTETASTVVKPNSI